jgi:hypothetical protein
MLYPSRMNNFAMLWSHVMPSCIASLYSIVPLFEYVWRALPELQGSATEGLGHLTRSWKSNMNIFIT